MGTPVGRFSAFYQMGFFLDSRFSVFDVTWFFYERMFSGFYNAGFVIKAILGLSKS